MCNCTDSRPAADATGDTQPLPQCSWPAILDDAGLGSCIAERAYVSCTDPSGAGCGCLSNDSTSCPASAMCGVAHGYTRCQDQCAANEYAVACGGPPKPDAADVNQQPLNGCRIALATPGGVAYCCPCE
jgi:hypothetical protein